MQDGDSGKFFQHPPQGETMNLQELYASKRRSAADCTAHVKSQDTIAAGPAAGFPLELINALSARPDIRDVQMYSALLVYLPDFLGQEQLGRIHYHSAFMGPVERMCMALGVVTPISVHFSRLSDFFGGKAVDTVFLEVSPPDDQGFMGIGPCAPMVGKSLLGNAKKVVVQVNPRVPRVTGPEVSLHLSEVDMLCEVDRPLFELPDLTPDAEEAAIAAHIAPFIPDGATLQLGIGKLANAVGDMLDSKRDLGIHTEVLTPSMVNLFEKGVITGTKKDLHPGKIVCTFCLGRTKDYEFLEKSGIVEMHPTKYVNNPYLIGRHKNFISVNSALAVDLTGQVAAEALGFEQYSATGGQLDFVRGAQMSEGGKSFIALKSTARKHTLSRIQLSLDPGTTVTTPRSDVQYIVTEFGVADLSLKSIPDRVKALIPIAHPAFREELARSAVEAGLIRTKDLGRLASAA
jgi:4-hydroxybutyrate CoA-transferase